MNPTSGSTRRSLCREKGVDVDGKARSEFLKKIATNGFSIEDNGDTLTLHPRGAESTATLVLKEVEINVWRVSEASGKYAVFHRGLKRRYFEDHITRWVFEALQEVAPPGAPVSQ